MVIGFDLSRLLVGLVHAGEQPASALNAIHELLVPAYAARMQAGQRPADPALPWHDLDAVRAPRGWPSASLS